MFKLLKDWAGFKKGEEIRLLDQSVIDEAVKQGVIEKYKIK